LKCTPGEKKKGRKKASRARKGAKILAEKKKGKDLSHLCHWEKGQRENLI